MQQYEAESVNKMLEDYEKSSLPKNNKTFLGFVEKAKRSMKRKKSQDTSSLMNASQEEQKIMFALNEFEPKGLFKEWASSIAQVPYEVLKKVVLEEDNKINELLEEQL